MPKAPPLCGSSRSSLSQSFLEAHLVAGYKPHAAVAVSMVEVGRTQGGHNV